MKRYTKKPVQIEAVQWDGNNTDEIIEWSEGKIVLTHTHPERLMISTLEGEMTAKPGAWIIKGVQGEFYPCKSGIFEATYEPTSVSASVINVI